MPGVLLSNKFTPVLASISASFFQFLSLLASSKKRLAVDENIYR